MNRAAFMHDVIQGAMQSAVPAAIFIALEGLYAAPAIAGDGVIVLQRDVPVRQAIREGAPGRLTSSIDVSPDDKVQQMVNGSRSVARSTELGDADFASVSTGTPQLSGMVAEQSNQSSLAGLTNGQLINSQLSSHGLSGGSASGGIGGAIGGGTAHIISSGVAGITGALTGMTGAIMRSSGQ